MMRLDWKHQESEPMFTFAKDMSNIRGISVTDTGSGALVGVLMLDALYQAMDAIQHEINLCETKAEARKTLN